MNQESTTPENRNSFRTNSSPVSQVDFSHTGSHTDDRYYHFCFKDFRSLEKQCIANGFDAGPVGKEMSVHYQLKGTDGNAVCIQHRTYESGYSEWIYTQSVTRDAHLTISNPVAMEKQKELCEFLTEKLQVNVTEQSFVKLAEIVSHRKLFFRNDGTHIAVVSSKMPNYKYYCHGSFKFKRDTLQESELDEKAVMLQNELNVVPGTSSIIGYLRLQEDTTHDCHQTIYKDLDECCRETNLLEVYDFTELDQLLQSAMEEYIQRPLPKGPKRMTADVVAAEEYWFSKSQAAAEEFEESCIKEQEPGRSPTEVPQTEEVYNFTELDQLLQSAMEEYIQRPLPKGPKRMTADVVAAEEYWFSKHEQPEGETTMH